MEMVLRPFLQAWDELQLHSYIFIKGGGMAAQKVFEINLADITTDKIPLHDRQQESQGQSRQLDYLNKEVPIYRMESSIDRLVVSCKEGAASAFLAHGDLIGKFYESSQLKVVSGVWFVGEFEGMFEWGEGEVFFEGKIHWMQLVTAQEKAFDDQDLNLVANYESSFLGYFKGRFQPWSAVGGLDNVLPDSLVLRGGELPVVEGNWNHVAREEVRRSQVKTEYLLPVLVRFQIKNLGDIDLENSSAVVNGHLYLEVRFSPSVEAMVEEKLRRDPSLSIHLSFNRDITLHLPLREQDESSEDSDWSIQDKTWDIQFTHHAQSNTYRYRILKRFRAEIDNSYGAFFAPFNLSRLKIVISLAPLQLSSKSGKVKVSFSCTDTFQYSPNGPYDPFAGFDELGDQEGKIPSSRQINRYHKINRHWCMDTGEYIIADNLLTLYPHYKVILLNKSFVNQDPLWGLALRDPLPLFLPPPARPISAAFHSLRDSPQELEGLGRKFFTFSFLRWNHAIIEVPIYKYIVIDMIKIFVPLTLITVLSLFIFQQENGVGVSSGFSTLAYRLVNIAALALVYVSLIPIIRSSLPDMPGVTLLEIITYLETLPSLLAIVNSMLYYTVPQQEWQKSFLAFHDGLFLLGLVLSLLNLTAFLILLIVYRRLRYRCPWKIDHYDSSLVKWRSPLYVAYMDSIRSHKPDYYHLSEE